MLFLVTATIVATLVGSSEAFATISFLPPRSASTISSSELSRNVLKPMQMGLDPHLFSSLLLSDEVTNLADQITGMADQAGAVTDQVGTVADQTAAVVSQAETVAQEVTKTDQGWLGFLTYPIEGLLQILHSVLVGVGVSSNAWGISIIALTVLVKVVTYPLTASQLQSTNKMQVLQPRIKEIQNKYQSNPQVMNEKVAAIYQEEQVNPLAGCLPALVQLPVFVGLYRAILDLAKEDKLSEPFLFLPNLEGPTYGADPATASNWIFKNWVDGVPSLGWDDTKAFLILPVVLVVSQYISQALITPKNQDPSQQQANVILKILPLMIGWFSLNVPAALGIYWVANNIITTLITLQIRSGFDTAPATASGATSTTTVNSPPSSAFRPAPIREKPSGFAAAAETFEGVKPITPIDAEIVEEPEKSEESAPAVTTEISAEVSTKTQAPKKKRGKGKKKGRKN